MSDNMKQVDRKKLLVRVTHRDGFKVLYHCNELIDAIILDRIHFPSEDNKTYRVMSEYEYNKTYPNEPLDPRFRQTAYSLSRISTLPFRIFESSY